MSKYKKNFVRFNDEDDDYVSDRREQRKKSDRRQWKKLKNDLRNKNFTIGDDDRSDQDYED